MAEDVTGRSRISVQPIKLGVLGGTFTVQAVFADSAQKADAVVERIRSTEADRWFVMLSEGRDADLDELALIDDAFEFQTLAAGTLESE